MDVTHHIIHFIPTVMKNLNLSLPLCRQAKAELRMATAKVDEMTKLLQTVQDQMQRQVREDKQMCRIKKMYCRGSLFNHLNRI